jgi:hypothetical protein
MSLDNEAYHTSSMPTQSATSSAHRRRDGAARQHQEEEKRVKGKREEKEPCR